jgi:DNA-binding NtrC family response regulator
VAEALERYLWPGNVRELRNALERALILSADGTVSLDLLPPEIRGDAAPAAEGPAQKLDELERLHIQRVLDSVQGNRTRAAELLGISRSTLKRKLAED